MSGRKILVRVSPNGDIQVEATGFRGNGCEAATQAIEEALGKRTARSLKPEQRQARGVIQQQQSLGES